MRDAAELRVPKWPFFLGDAVACGLAYFIYRHGNGPLSHWEISAICICAGAGALLGVVPFVMEYRAALKLIETSSVSAAMEKLQNLEALAQQISGVSNLWQTAQEQADRTVNNSREVVDRMAAEVKSFNQFMEKINEGEKATLRLEVEKLRRAENDWLNVVVHMLDHAFALHRGAERSGQANVIAQVGNFQNACRDIARRIGLVPVMVDVGEPFNPARHQWADGETAPAGANVGEMLATGFTFQGRLVRPPLVRLQNAVADKVEEAPVPDSTPTPTPKPADPDQLLLAPEEPF